MKLNLKFNKMLQTVFSSKFDNTIIELRMCFNTSKIFRKPLN